MAKMMGPRFKQSRRLGLNVCGHPKANKRMGKGLARNDKKLTEYGLQLLEKQRLRAYYGVMEKQFRTYVEKALRQKERITGDALVMMLETRLDNLVYRMGFASSIRQARQMVVHHHILVNGKRVDRPSYEVKVGDVISLRERSQSIDTFKNNFKESLCNLSYLQKDENNLSGKLVALPSREEVPIEVTDSLIIEYYSK